MHLLFLACWLCCLAVFCSVLIRPERCEIRLRMETDVAVIHAYCNMVYDEMTDTSKVDWEPFEALSVCCGYVA